MDFGKTAMAIGGLAIGGLALYFFSRGKAPAAAGAGGTFSVDGYTFDIPKEPGTYEFEIPAGGNGGNGGELLPEYVPPPAYPTQAPSADEFYPLGSPENPLYAEIPQQMIPYTGPGSWYEIRRIEETLGWTPEEYVEQRAIIRETPAQERTVEQQYAAGYSDTMEQAQEAVDFKTRVQLYGGEYIGGILVPPDTWGGSVTEFAQYVRAALDR